MAKEANITKECEKGKGEGGGTQLVHGRGRMTIDLASLLCREGARRFRRSIDNLVRLSALALAEREGGGVRSRYLDGARRVFNNQADMACIKREAPLGVQRVA